MNHIIDGYKVIPYCGFYTVLAHSKTHCTTGGWDFTSRYGVPQLSKEQAEKQCEELQRSIKQ